MTDSQESSLPDEGVRLSFDGGLCTVRYTGNVEGTTGKWLGVEWDDPTRGKHSGEHKGVKYFHFHSAHAVPFLTVGKSKHPTAGSFVRPGRTRDRPLSFLEAAHEKYVSEFQTLKPAGSGENAVPEHEPIEISGKIVEEVGFEKIRKLLAELQELRIVLLDGMWLQGVLADRGATPAEREVELERIRNTCPKITKLDLSRNLLESWTEVTDICLQLSELKILKLNGNRLHTIKETRALTGVSELSLNETLLSWEEVVAVLNRLPSLTALSLSFNQLSNIPMPLTNTVEDLTLDFNDFESLDSLQQLASLPNLRKLSLRGNKLDRVSASNVNGAQTHPDLVFSPNLTSLDIAHNNIDSWSFIDVLPRIFPGLSILRVSSNPLFNQPPASSTVTNLPDQPMTVDEAFMLTISRLSQLKTLNFTTITAKERVNGELYYLGLIRKELLIYPASAEERILRAHPRYRELCETYEVPDLKRKSDSDEDPAINPRALGARLINFTFYMPSPTRSDSSETTSSAFKVFSKEIPRSFDIYRIKALVARHFSLPPLHFRLIWETDEWDPVEQGTAEEDEWDSEKECGDDLPPASNSKPVVQSDESGRKKFVRREEELVDSTKEIGFWFSDDIRAARARIEIF